MLARLDALRHDLGFVLRPLRRAPVHTATVVATFALGVGANATMFGIVDRLLLRPPEHVAAPRDVVQVQREFRLRAENRSGSVLSYPMFAALRDGVGRFASVAMYTPAKPVSLGVGVEARPVRYVLVSGGYFATLGTRMALGRPLLPADDVVPAGSPVAVIGHGLWQRRFGGARSVLGTAISLGARRYTVVGVAPAGFTGVERRPVDVWLPVSAAAGLRSPGADWSTDAGVTWLQVVARLAPGVSPGSAAAEAGAVLRAPQLASTGGEDTTTSVTLRSVLPGHQPDFAAEKRVALLLGAVSLFVLLLAATNVATLLLVRALRRRREIAVLVALGVRRARLVRQLALEGVVLALLGGCAALGVVEWGSELVERLLLDGYAWPDSPLDGRVLAFTAAAALSVGLLAGLIPALLVGRMELSPSLREGARGIAPSHRRAQAALLVVQIALSLAMLVGTGLFVASLRNVAAVDVGLDVDRVVVGRIDVRSVGLDSAASEAYYREAVERVRALPGVASAVLAEAPPLSGWSMGTSLRVAGHDSLPQLDPETYRHAVSPGYFATVGTRILRGREFLEGDAAPGAEPVVIVGEAAARALWPDGAALGGCVRVGESRPSCARVVGIAEDTHRGDVTGEARGLQVYEPFGTPELGPRGYVLLARAAGVAPERLVEPVRLAMQSAGAALPFADVQTLRGSLDAQLRPWRLGATMFAAFGTLAVLLAALGLYGVVAYSVALRTHEFGVRAALGATRAGTLRLVLRHALRVTALGILAGVLVAVPAGRIVRPLLYRVSPGDPAVFGAAIGLLVAVALLATLSPALRATRVDPLDALRAE